MAAEGDAKEPTRQSIEVTFAVLHRYLGVGVGEHLGYLLTGLWTLLAAASIVTTTPIRRGSAGSASRSVWRS